MEGKEPITKPEEILEALAAVKDIEIMRFAMEETKFLPKYFNAINHCMQTLGTIHDDIVSRLPPEVIEAERAKSGPPRNVPVAPKIIRPDEMPVGGPNGA